MAGNCQLPMLADKKRESDVNYKAIRYFESGEKFLEREFRNFMHKTCYK